MATRLLLGTLVALALGTPARGQEDGAQVLAEALRPLLLQALPPVLYEKAEDWGRQKLVANGVRWHGLRPEIMRGPRNDGIWRKIKVTAQGLPDALELKISDFKNVDAERQTFKVFVALQAGFEMERQHWEDGIRLFSGSARGHLRLKLALDCENVIRVEPGKGLLPAVVLRFRIAKAELTYDNLVIEHLAGVGGTGARLMGELVRSSFKQWHPSLERRLLERANRAIVKAADTREVRLGLTQQK